MTIEDSIFAAFMHFIGYDILIFVPTGYNIIEKYFNHEIWETHQIGAYKYDVIFTPQKRKRSLFKIAFGGKMTKNNILYAFEHDTLPKMFFTNMKKFITSVNQEALYKVLTEMFKSNNVANPYTQKDILCRFLVFTTHKSEEIYLIEITFPKPERETLCYRSYILFNRNLAKTSYFTIEKAEKDDTKCFVCEWDKNQRHTNHGKCNLEEDFDLCKEIYKKTHNVEWLDN